MRIIKPNWISHNGSIESLDISPDGKRLVTCGVDNLIRIWSMDSILDSQIEQSSRAKLLAELNDHLSGVNVVRWSPVGLLLASGSMDKTVMLYHLDPTGGSGFGTNTPEHWSRRSTLTGFHKEDVTDLAFSPDGRHVVSCDFAGDVVLWNVKTGRCEYHKSAAHDGPIKGVAWDPLGRYVASQGVDRSVRIWRTDDWRCEATIQAPLRDALEVFQMRLHWSPDGMFLAVPNAVKDKFYVCAVIDRVKFEHLNEFVGHRKPVVVARWNPLVFERGGSGAQAVCCAIGSYDAGISVWHSAKDRPITAIKDLFQQHVTDLAWSSDGLVLAACSNDGTVALLQFETGELGHASKPTVGLRAAADEDAVAEDPALAEMLEASARERRAQEQAMNQIVHRAPQVNVLKPRVRTAAAGPSASGHRERVPMLPVIPAAETDTAAGVSSVARHPPVAPSNLSNLAAATAAMERREERLAALTPTLAATPTPALPAAASSTVSAAAPMAVAAPGQTVATKRKRAPRPADSAEVPLPRAALGGEAMAATAPVLTPSELARALGRVYTVPAISESISVQIMQGDSAVAVARVWRSGISSLVSWTRMGDQSPRWEALLHGTAALAAGTSKFLSVVTSEGTLYLLDAFSGRLLYPPMVLPSSPLNIAAGGRSDSLLFIVCADGSATLQDVVLGQSVLQTSILPILRRSLTAATVDRLQITPTDSLAVSMSDGTSFVYNIGLGLWSVAADPSQRMTEFAADPLAAVGGVLAGLQTRLASISTAQAALVGDERAAAAAATLFLESQIALARQLSSTAETEAWTLAYARHLAATGDDGRLRALCSSLLGTPSAPGDHNLLRRVFAVAARQQRIVSEFMHSLELFTATDSMSM